MPSSIDSLIPIIMEEYKALREEMRTIVDRQYSFIYWTISSLAVMFAAILNSWKSINNNVFISSALFFFLFPSVLTAYFVSWSHIIVKISRIGSHLYMIESKISYILKKEISLDSLPLKIKKRFLFPMNWEHSLWNPKSHLLINRTFKGVKIASISVFVLIISLGLYVFYFSYWNKQNIFPNWLFILLIFIFMIPWSFVWHLFFRKLESDLLLAQKELAAFESDLAPSPLEPTAV